MGELERRVYERFKALLGDVEKASIMTWCGPSAAYGYLLLQWIGANRSERSLRVNPYGKDLEEVLSEFAAQCREASLLPESASGSPPHPDT